MSSCVYWDSGWCYHPEGPSTGCTGYDNCEIIATDKEVDEDE